jgi:membrane protease YdiL (CAAX protease family)
LNELNEALTPNNNEALPPQPSTLHRIFFGADGLRAGWSILIFVILFAALLKGVGFVAHAVHLLPPRAAKNTPPPEMTPMLAIISEAIPFLVALFVSWIMSKIERRPVGVYGLGSNRKLPLFLGGLVWGVVCLSVLVFTLWKTGLLVFDSRLLFGSDIFRYGAAWLLGFFLVGLLEEYLTRGYLQYTLARGLTSVYKWMFQTIPAKTFGFWTAALVFSIMFGLGHSSNNGESPIGLFAAGIAGLVFCLSLWRTGSLWWAIGFHTTWDWAESFLYGVADSGTMVKYHLFATHPVGKPLLSGGATGPEGSIFALLMMALVACIIIFTLPRAQPTEATHPPTASRAIEA